MGAFDHPDVWRSRSRGFSMGLAAPHGVPVFLTGQVAWDADERIVGAGDVGEQTRQCYRNIAALLSRVGGRLGDLVDTTTFLLDAADLPAVQRVREELALDPPPASTSIVVAGLGDPGFLVEIKAVAAVPRDRYREP